MTRLVVLLLSLPIWIYQRTISPLLGPTCRFYPSCSSYALLSLRQYSLLTAVRKILGRLGRCHPFHPGGYDPP